jgi:hypothetical protein
MTSPHHEELTAISNEFQTLFGQLSQDLLNWNT